MAQGTTNTRAYRERLRGLLKQTISATAAAAVLLTGLVLTPQAAVAEDTTETSDTALAAVTEGCSYGQGGPKADALCWIDFSDFGSVTPDDLVQGPVAKDMVVSLGRYEVSFTATVEAGSDGAQGVSATALPTWGGSVLGNTNNGLAAYLGTSGKPAFYQTTVGKSGENLLKDTITLSNITVIDTETGHPVTSGYSLVMADAEATGTGEGFNWQSSSALHEYTRVVPTGWAQPCTAALTGLGTTSVDCTGAPNTSGGGRGILMVSADAPNWISSSFRNNNADSREGVAFALVFSTVNSVVNVDQTGGGDAVFEISATTGGTEVGHASSVVDNTGQSGIQQYLSGAEGSTVTYTATKAPGSTTPEAAYTLTWECTVNGEPVTPTPATGKTASIEVPANGTGTCVANWATNPPTADPDAKTINPGETATLTPGTAQGKGELSSATFDDGSTTKIVPGEGTWTIELVGGEVTATFTPEDGFTGPVTQQSYTVTDENGLTATSTLDVTIRPAAGDASKTINPNQIATLEPTTIPGTGDITEVTFDNGTTTKVVPGEGSWTIELVDGEVTATFTPEPDYDGPVTSQKYTVTDVNGETADGTLSVNINVPPQARDSDRVIEPNEVATLQPTTIPGTGDITEVTFDTGTTTKVVPGEGSWTIELVDGEVTATFAPEPDYDGPVTPQTYTVTDQNGLQATANLEIAIVHTSLTIDKDYRVVSDSNKNGINDTGDRVRWTFTVTNTGNIELEHVTVNDPKLVKLGITVTCEVTKLAPQASVDCESEDYVITAADVTAGTIDNVATASGTVPQGTPGAPANPTSAPDEVKIPTASDTETGNEDSPEKSNTGTTNTPESSDISDTSEPLSFTGGNETAGARIFGLLALLSGVAIFIVSRRRKHTEV